MFCERSHMVQKIDSKYKACQLPSSAHCLHLKSTTFCVGLISVFIQANIWFTNQSISVWKLSAGAVTFTLLHYCYQYDKNKDSA